MNRDRIPRYYRRGIFSGLILLGVGLLGGLAAQSGPHLQIRQSSAPSIAGPAAAASDTIRVLALRVAFEADDNVSTTGDGQFLTEEEPLNCDGFPVDPPPHDASYFSDHLLAVGNYFRQVSGGLLELDSSGRVVFPPQGQPPIQVGPMASYRPVADQDSDSLLVSLADTVIRAAFYDGVDLGAYQLLVIFHAGLGQDFEYQSLDPTPLDIPSAYIDSAMMTAALGSSGIPLPDGSVYRVPIILAPESQNHIYYDIAVDLFFGAEDYCDLQTGLTGTLALLIGYALGFPPLFDTVEGETGVGVFGLMDLGSNNGRGLIPAPPTAWTRVQQRWEQPVELSGPEALTARHLEGGRIGRITLSRNEYLLVENRVNWVGTEPGVDLDSLLYRNRYEVSPGDTLLPPYFDYLVDSTAVEVAASGVITSLPDYDLGLPGSGLLVWHVDETRYTTDMAGINNRPAARAVALLEADGAMDLGFPTTALFARPEQGWRWDLWYAGNEGYFMANPDRLAGNQERWLSLDSETHPSSRLNSGAKSGVGISRIGPAGDTLSFIVGEDAGGGVVEITRLPEGSRLLGFNGDTWIYELGDSLWLGDQRVAILIDSISPNIISEYDAVSSPGEGFWGLTLKNPGYLAQRFLPDGTLEFSVADTVRVATIGITPLVHPHLDAGKLTIWVEDNPVPPPPDTTRIRYLVSPLTVMDLSLYWVSEGDIDGDGNDEKVRVYKQVPSTLTVRNDNRIVLDGFPVEGDLRGVALIANLIDDIRPEIVVVESGDITIYSPEGREQLRLGLQAEPEEFFLMHTSDGRVGLANGDRIHWFEPQEPNPQWVTPQGRHSRNRVSLNDGRVKVPQPAVLDKARVYNYPNPVTGGNTTIRFYTGSATRANIRIFTVEGLPVREVTLTNLATNDYNEWVWQVGDNPSGLYYAVVEVEGARTKSALVKIAVVK